MDGAIHLTVNGQRVEADDPDLRLGYFLRNDLELKGVRAGCGEGFCGSCTVLCDGEPLKACLTPVREVAGTSVTTPEGLGTPQCPHPVQQAFVDEQAAQCGYCINGFVMRVAAAAADGRVPSDEEFDEDHRCRCGSHPRIRRAAECARDAMARGFATGEGTVAADDRALAPPPVEPLSRDVTRVEAWLQLLADGRIAALSGKVELGQGIRTALAQIVASQLGVEVDRVVVVPTTTAASVDESYTAGSNSVDTGGAALGRAAVAFRRHLLARAGALSGVTPDSLHLDARGVVEVDGRLLTLAEVAAAGPIVGDIGADDLIDWTRLGASRKVRSDLPAKVTGAGAFIHDLVLPGMVHARALLPPSYDARLTALEVAGAKGLDGVLDIVVDGRLVLVIAEREEQAVRGVARLGRDASWELPDLPADAAGLTDLYRRLDGEPFVAASAPDGQAAHVTTSASYVVPYQAHASIAPSCALAKDQDGHLEVFSHSQGVYPLRDSIADLVGLESAQLTVAHRDGPGCYGHNLADDAAAMAAIAARAIPGRAVRFQFSMEDEFSWEPYGPAMVIDIAASLVDGCIAYWDHHAITGTHSFRPRGTADNLLPAWLRAAERPRPRVRPFEGGTRNAVPIYDLPVVDAVADHVDGPLRTSSLRTLGSFANTFANESFMDELAEHAGQDPVAFRLAHLGDERARRVLSDAAELAGLAPRVGPSGVGRGIAVSRYKHEEAYVAAVADVEVDPEAARVRVTRLLLVCDAGTVVNRDGLINQIEGGALQGLSRLLHEAVVFDRRRVTSRDWATYPVLGFGDLPEIDVVLVDSDAAPLGVGEASLGPAAAAVANAIDDAIGVRVRTLPFTPKQLTDRMYSLDDSEMGRVRLT